MPSFDIVSEIDQHEVNNAVDQANREVSTRFDFKGTCAKYELQDSIVTQIAESEFHLQQMLDILKIKLAKRGVDVLCLKLEEMQMTGKQASQEIILRQGLEPDLARNIVKKIKDAKLKVQSSIQGEKVRVNGKKRDDLQQVIQFLKNENYDLPLQFNNFRD